MPKSGDQSIPDSLLTPLVAPGGHRSERGRETRRRLAAAAAQLIVEVGWDRVTTRAVAERAGVNNALVHYHFGTMDALLREAATAAFAEVIEIPIRATDGAASLLEALEMLVDTMGGLTAADSLVTRLTSELMVQASRDEAIRKWMAAQLAVFREWLTDALAEAVARGEIREVEPRGTAVVLAALLDGLLLHYMADPELNLEGAQAALARLLRKEPP